MKKKFKMWFYCWWYGHKFESGYSYQRIKHTNLDVMEKHHYLLVGDGWVQDGDIKTNLTHAYCWYKKNKVL